MHIESPLIGNCFYIGHEEVLDFLFVYISLYSFFSVKIFEVIQTEKTLYMVMEYASGGKCYGSFKFLHF